MKLSLLLPVLGICQTVYANDAERGKVVAEVRCTPCHHLHLASVRIGPGLKDIFNRKPVIEGVPYERWDEVALDQWLTNPRAVKPNTEMVMPPLSGRDRSDVIAYLRQDKSDVDQD
ncbi:MAG: hypothetical protein AUJ56_06270 [Zetaproteobacteria bacterium CG1_02_49_23]|nr:MAG: hypothetical protein AUJ56_06270 [Zetaproteobacteria bacterium CG1_02_49_23]